jgi:hypothetical protein
MSQDIINNALANREIYFAKFDKTMQFEVNYRYWDDDEEQTDQSDEEDYEKKCVETFLNWNGFVWSELEMGTLYYYMEIEGIDELTEANSLNINLPEDIWQYCYPTRIMFVRFKENPMDVFTVVSLECEWESEHGLSWVVKNTDEPIFIGAQGNLHSINEKQEHFNYA